MEPLRPPRLYTRPMPTRRDVAAILRPTVLPCLIALAIAACGVMPPSAAGSLSAIPGATCLVVTGEEIVSLAWSQDMAQIGRAHV